CLLKRKATAAHVGCYIILHPRLAPARFAHLDCSPPQASAPFADEDCHLGRGNATLEPSLATNRRPHRFRPHDGFFARGPFVLDTARAEIGGVEGTRCR